MSVVNYSSKIDLYLVENENHIIRTVYGNYNNVCVCVHACVRACVRVCVCVCVCVNSIYMYKYSHDVKMKL